MAVYGTFHIVTIPFLHLNGTMCSLVRTAIRLCGSVLSIFAPINVTRSASWRCPGSAHGCAIRMGHCNEAVSKFMFTAADRCCGGARLGRRLNGRNTFFPSLIAISCVTPNGRVPAGIPAIVVRRRLSSILLVAFGSPSSNPLRHICTEADH